MGKERMLVTGGHALEGQVRVSGGKNTAVAVIPATLLCDEPCTIENLPDIEDVCAYYNRDAGISGMTQELFESVKAFFEEYKARQK